MAGAPAVLLFGATALGAAVGLGGSEAGLTRRRGYPFDLHVATGKVDADGKYTTTSPSTNDTKGWLVLVHPQGWRLGFRRELRLETFKDIQKGMNILVASFRQAQIPSGIATIHTAVGRNLTV